MRVLGIALLVVAAAFLGASAVVAGHALPLIVALLALLPVLLGWITLLEYVVVGSPFMFYVSLGGPLHAAASDAVVPLLALALLVTGDLPRESQRGIRRVVGFALLATTAAVASGAFAALMPRGFVLSEGVANLAKLVIVLGYSCVVTAAVAALPMSRAFRALRIWGWVAAVLAAGSMVTSFGGVPLIPGNDFRSFGFFQDPNLYAGYLLISLAVVIARECHRGMPETPFLLVALSGGVAATASRSAVATLAVMLFLSALLISARRVRWTLVGLGILGVWVTMGVLAARPDLLAFPAFQRLTSASEVAGNDPRLALWGRALDLWHSSPITGIGIGQYQLYSEDVYGISGRTGTGFVVHNTFLSFLTETGVIGLLVLVAGLIAVARTAAGLGDLGCRIDKALLIGVVAVVAQMMTLNLQNVRYVWILIGFILGLELRRRSNPEELSPSVSTAADAPSAPRPERQQPATVR